jgi:peptidoglycan/xylan/chitin deacetylase (PgdA/CDA1 family)
MTNISPDGAIRVAVTVDDFVLWDGLPMPAGVTPLGITKSMAATLTEHGVSGVCGFAHTHRLDLDPSLMAAWEAWVEAGHHLGNHTHLHAPLRWMSAAQYCADIDKAEKFIGNLIELAIDVIGCRIEGEATGILMARHQVTREEAVGILRQASGSSGRELPEIAIGVVCAGDLAARHAGAARRLAFAQRRPASE